MKAFHLFIMIFACCIIGCGQPSAEDEGGLLQQPFHNELSKEIAENEMVVSVGKDGLLSGLCIGKTSKAFDLFSISADGKTVRQLTNTPENEELWARISPNRKQIIFYSSPRGVTSELCRYSKHDLWVMNADGTNQKILLSLERVKKMNFSVHGHGEWSPDGKKILMLIGKSMSELNIYLLDIETGTLEQLTDREGINTDPSWTPDGQEILFIGCPDGKKCKEKDHEIFSIPANSRKTKEAKRLTNDKDSANDVYVSPDGKRIAWLRVKSFVPQALETFHGDYSKEKGITNIRACKGGLTNWMLDSSSLLVNITSTGKLFGISQMSLDCKIFKDLSPKEKFDKGLNYMFPTFGTFAKS